MIACVYSLHFLRFLGSDPVDNIAVSPRGPYYKDVTVHCTAEGYPLPTFKWTNLKNEDLADGDTLVISGDVGDNYICIAANTIKGTAATRSRPMAIEVSPRPPDSSTWTFFVL